MRTDTRARVHAQPAQELLGLPGGAGGFNWHEPHTDGSNSIAALMASGSGQVQYLEEGFRLRDGRVHGADKPISGSTSDRASIPFEVMAIEAIIFDFDGVLVETEEPEYLVWRHIWAEAGLDLPLEAWSSGIGTVPGKDACHPFFDLVARSGRNFDPDELRSRTRRMLAELLDAMELQPGVAQ